MARFLFPLLFALLFSGLCRAETGATLESASTLLHRITGAQVRPYSGRDFGREKYTGAISVLVDETKAEDILLSVRKELPAGFVAFVGTTRSLTSPPAVGVELVIGPGSGPLDILRIAKTDAVNYGMVTKDLEVKLAQWHKVYGIDIWQAETDTVQLRLKRMPRDIKSFASEVYKFCPDIVDQGVGTQQALIKDIQDKKGLYLWWD